MRLSTPKIALAVSLLIVALALLLSACDASGLSVAPTPAPNQATPTAVAQAPPATAITQPTATTADSQATIEPPPPVATGSSTSVAAGTEQPTTESTPTDVASSLNTPSPSTPSAISHEVTQIESQAAEIRGLKPKKDVPESFINQQQLHDNLVKDQAKSYTHEQAKEDATEIWLLRLSEDRNLDLYQLYIDLQTEQVAGYYDPKAKELFVLSGSSLSPLSKQTLAHEFTHALQDQYYDLEKLLPDDVKGEDDKQLAIRSLVEGDASLSGLMWAYQYLSKDEFQQMIQESQNSSTAVLDKAPKYIQRSLLFPYDEGANYVSKLIERGNFSAVNKALTDPPVSTEQIMHPEKYLQTPRDLPKVVALLPMTDTLGTGWGLKSYGTFGEFDINVLLGVNGDANANTDASGWGGGEYNVYINGGSAVVLMGTKWDTTSAMNRYKAALQATFASDQQTNGVWSDNNGRSFAIKQSGDTVILISGTDSQLVEKAAAGIK